MLLYCSSVAWWMDSILWIIYIVNGFLWSYLYILTVFFLDIWWKKLWSLKWRSNEHRMQCSLLGNSVKHSHSYSSIIKYKFTFQKCSYVYRENMMTNKYYFQGNKIDGWLSLGGNFHQNWYNIVQIFMKCATLLYQKNNT